MAKAKAKKKNPVGTPRTVSLPKKDMIKLGEEMIQFISDPGNNVFHVSEWYSIQKGYLYSEWETMIKRPEFVRYYEQSLKIIGKKYLDGTVNPTIASRWQRSYFKDLKKEEDKDAQERLDRELDQKKKAIDHEMQAKAAHEANRGIAPNDSSLTDILKELKRSNAAQPETNPEL